MPLVQLPQLWKSLVCRKELLALFFTELSDCKLDPLLSIILGLHTAMSLTFLRWSFSNLPSSQPVSEAKCRQDTVAHPAAGVAERDLPHSKPPEFRNSRDVKQHHAPCFLFQKCPRLYSELTVKQFTQRGRVT